MKKVITLILALAIAASTFTACGNKPAQSAEPSGAVSAPAASGTTTAPEKLDIWGKYEPSIEVSAVASYNVPEDGVVPKDTTPENQKWVEIMEKYLGIKLKYDWVVPASQGTQKLDVTIASGQIPDILQVDENQFELLKDSDMLGDLTEAYKYLLEPIRKNLETDPTLLKKCTNEKGELVAGACKGLSFTS